MRLDEFKEFLDGIKERPTVLYFQEIYMPNKSHLDIIGWYTGHDSSVTCVSLDGVFMGLKDASKIAFRTPFSKRNGRHVVCINLHYCLSDVVGEAVHGVEDVKEFFRGTELERYIDLVDIIGAVMK